MERLLEKIDKYIEIQEKKELISLSIDASVDFEDIVEMVKKSSDREKTISMFNKEVQRKIQDLIDGGIL
jgi:Cft2 family RNA processing exonuclease